MFQLLRNYFANRKQLKTDLISNKAAMRLHGVNLNDWRYLGFSQISFSYTDSERAPDIAYIFFFCGIDDTARRKYVLIPESKSNYMQDRFQTHPWVIKQAELWKASERELYDCVNREPSKFLKEMMLKEHKAVWSTETNWWSTDDNAKYEQAKTQAKKKSKKEAKILPVEDNIVKIDFNKDREIKT